MWKALLVLLALGVIFVILLKLLERWSGKAVPGREGRPAVDEDRSEERGEEEPPEPRAEQLVHELASPDAEVAREAASKLLMLGPLAIEPMLGEFLRVERGRREHHDAVVARRFEETLVAFGPAAIRPCLEGMTSEKDSFEVFRGVRAVMTGIGDAAARPVVDAIQWLSAEGLYIRSLLLLKALGPGAVGTLLRAIEGAEGRTRELAVDLLLDLSRFHPEAVRARVRDGFGAGQHKGLMVSPEVRHALLTAATGVGVSAAELPALEAALADPDPRVRREAWTALATLPEAGPRCVAHPLDPDPGAAAAQLYARDRFGLDPLEGDRGPGVEVARMAVLSRRPGGPPLEALERALGEGPLEARREAAQALAHVGTEEAGRILARGLGQCPVPLLSAMAMALGRTPCEPALPTLFELWEERGGNSLRRAVASVGEAAARKLLEVVSRRRPGLMEPAALVLGTLGEVTRQPLVDLLSRLAADDPALFAVEIALEVQGESAVPALLPLLDHAELHVVEVAAWVLCQVGDPRALAPLLAHLDRLGDRSPVLDFVRQAPPEVRADVLRFVEAHLEHPDAEALRQAAMAEPAPRS